MDKTNTLKNTYICMLAGGAGTRLWPNSREAHPKQFSNLFEKHSLFQQTIKRIKGLIPLSRVIVITNQRYVKEIHKQEPFLPEENIISEPLKKDTALAIGAVTALIYKRNPKAIIINLATDHYIKDLSLYHETLKAAAITADQKQSIVTIGIKPEYPHTGMGHIKVGKKNGSQGKFEVFEVEGFKEKPPLDLAKKFTESGDYYWNSNKFVFPAAVMIQEFETHAPIIAKNLQKLYEAFDTPKETQVIKEVYESSEGIAIDYAIAEKTKKLLLIPGHFGWSDVGDWKVVYDLSDKDQDQNVLRTDNGLHLNIDTKNTLINWGDRLIATIGVEDLIIIDTKDALLIAKKDRAQDVKKIVESLKEKKLNQYL